MSDVPDAAFFGMTDLEERLASPEGAAVAAEAISRLQAELSALDQAMAAGLPPADHERAGKLLAGLSLARAFLAGMSGEQAAASGQ